MKNLILIFLLAISCSTFAQTIRRCNNNPGVSGVNVYTTIQAAHDASVTGDIIYVEPSTTNYGSLTCIKRLTIIGNGYFLNQNLNVSFDIRQSAIYTIDFGFGSANSVVRGITISNLGGGGQFAGVSFTNVSNITINRCKIEGSANFNSTPPSNITFSQCIITGNIYAYSTAQSYYATNCTFTNNIIGGGLRYFVNATITNNIFYSGPDQSSLINCTITNNIWKSNACNSCTPTPILDASSSGNTVSNNIIVFSGNISSASSLPTGNGNVYGDYLSTYLLADPTSVALVDKNFQLAAGSPAIGIGTGGTNAGAFGGANPYILSGLPAYPIMTNFTTSGVGNTSTPLQVNVTVRGNN